MAVLAETVKKTGGLTVHVVKTEKYKTNTLVFKMKAPISGEEISLRALLPYVLQSNSKKFLKYSYTSKKLAVRITLRTAIIVLFCLPIGLRRFKTDKSSSSAQRLRLR